MEGQPTEPEIEFAMAVEDWTVRYLEQCRTRNEEPSARGLALFLLEDTGEHVIGTAGAYTPKNTMANMLASLSSNATGIDYYYRVILTRERRQQ